MADQSYEITDNLNMAEEGQDGTGALFDDPVAMFDDATKMFDENPVYVSVFAEIIEELGIADDNIARVYAQIVDSMGISEEEVTHAFLTVSDNFSAAESPLKPNIIATDNVTIGDQIRMVVILRIDDTLSIADAITFSKGLPVEKGKIAFVTTTKPSISAVSIKPKIMTITREEKK